MLCGDYPETGNKEFLDFLLRGRESQVSWENLLLRLEELLEKQKREGND